MGENVMNCVEARDLLSAWLDGEAAGDGPALELHLEGCGECSRELAELKQTVAAVQALPRLTVPGDFASRVMGALDAEPSLVADAEGAAPDTIAQPLVATPARSLRGLRWIASAAVVTLGVGLAALSSTTRMNVGRHEDLARHSAVETRPPAAATSSNRAQRQPQSDAFELSTIKSQPVQAQGMDGATDGYSEEKLISKNELADNDTEPVLQAAAKERQPAEVGSVIEPSKAGVEEYSSPEESLVDGRVGAPKSPPPGAGREPLGLERARTGGRLRELEPDENRALDGLTETEGPRAPASKLRGGGSGGQAPDVPAQDDAATQRSRKTVGRVGSGRIQDLAEPEPAPTNAPSRERQDAARRRRHVGLEQESPPGRPAAPLPEGAAGPSGSADERRPAARGMAGEKQKDSALALGGLEPPASTGGFAAGKLPSAEANGSFDDKQEFKVELKGSSLFADFAGKDAVVLTVEAMEAATFTIALEAALADGEELSYRNFVSPADRKKAAPAPVFDDESEEEADKSNFKPTTRVWRSLANGEQRREVVVSEDTYKRILGLVANSGHFFRVDRPGAASSPEVDNGASEELDLQGQLAKADVPERDLGRAKRGADAGPSLEGANDGPAPESESDGAESAAGAPSASRRARGEARSRELAPEVPGDQLAPKPSRDLDPAKELNREDNAPPAPLQQRRVRLIIVVKEKGQ